MAETRFAETEALLKILNGEPHDDVLAYLRALFSVRELQRFADQLNQLAGLCEEIIAGQDDDT